VEAGLAEIIAHLPVFVRGVGGEVVYWSEGCRELFGYDAAEAQGSVARELLRTELPQPLETLHRTLLTRGQWSGRLRHVTKAGSELWTETAWRLRDSRDPGGPIVIEQHTDITERVALEAKSALLARELEHRVKNVLNVVQALARMTFPDAPKAQRDALDQRIIALSEANKVLQGAAWEEADLRAIVAEVAGRLGVAERIEADGPPAAIVSDQAMGLALVIHELCTNALKYGALSQAGGRVKLTWDSDPDDPNLVRARWEETGGPPVEPPAYKGFGTLLIRRALPGAARSPTELRFEREGVVCEMTLQRAGA
jgi:two-component system CheB/CheR fusion protein